MDTGASPDQRQQADTRRACEVVAVSVPLREWSLARLLIVNAARAARNVAAIIAWLNLLAIPRINDLATIVDVTQRVDGGIIRPHPLVMAALWAVEPVRRGEWLLAHLLTSLKFFNYYKRLIILRQISQRRK